MCRSTSDPRPMARDDQNPMVKDDKQVTSSPHLQQADLQGHAHQAPDKVLHAGAMEMSRLADQPLPTKEPLATQQGCRPLSEGAVMPEIAMRLASMTMPFTMDGFVDEQGKNAVCNNYCSIPDHPFECTDVRGHHVWLHAPFADLKRMLLHYKDCKAAAPQRTSACVLAPAWRKADFSPYLKGMQLLCHFKEGTPLYLNSDNRTPILCPWAVNAYFDPPQIPADLSALHIHALSMMFATNIAGHEATVLLDSGASENFVSQDFCRHAGLRAITAATPTVIKLGDGSDMSTRQQCLATFRLQSLPVSVTCHITPLPAEISMVLGDDWLKMHKAQLDFEQASCTLIKAKRRHVLSNKLPAADSPEVLLVLLMSADQSATTDLDTAAVEKWQHVLKDFQDVFPADLPAGLPPHRGTGHVITLEQGTRPVFRPMFRYSPGELEEIKKKRLQDSWRKDT